MIPAINARKCPFESLVDGKPTTCAAPLFGRSASAEAETPERYCEQVEDPPYEAWGRTIVDRYEVQHVHYRLPIRYRQSCARGHVFEWTEPRRCATPGCSYRGPLQPPQEPETIAAP